MGHCFEQHEAGEASGGIAKIKKIVFLACKNLNISLI